MGEISNAIDMPWAEVEPILQHMEDLGILEINEEGSTAFKMDTGEFDEYVRLDKWQKTEAMEPIIQGMGQPQKTEQMSEMNDRQKEGTAACERGFER